MGQVKRARTEALDLQKGLSPDVKRDLRLTSLFDAEWTSRVSVCIEGEILSLKNRPEWNYTQPQETCQFWFFCVDDACVYFRLEGIADEHTLSKAALTLAQVLKDLQGKARFFIQDFSSVNYLSYAGRQQWFSASSRRLWPGSEICLIVPKSSPSIFLHPASLTLITRTPTIMTQTLAEALRFYQTRLRPSKFPSPDFSPTVMPRPLESYTREELELELVALRREHELQKQREASHIDSLLQALSHVSWSEHFSPALIPEPASDDPFSPLIVGTNLLQKDIYEMVSRFRELQVSLKSQVEERTHQLAIQKANLQSLIESTDDQVLSADLDFNILVINSACQTSNLRVYKKVLEPGANLLDAFADLPEATAYWKPLFERAFAGETFRFVEKMTLKGDPVYFEISFCPIHNQKDGITGASYFIKDITLREKALEESRHKEQLLTSINYSIQEAIFRTVPGKGIIYVNKAFVEMFGYDSVEEVLKLEPDELYVDTSRRYDFVRHMKDNTHFINEEVKYKRKNGSTFWGLISSIKSENKDTGELYFDGAIRDVTALREAERKLRDQYDELVLVNEELQKVNTELDSFVYKSSHDLRAPLVSVQGLINVARMADTPEDRDKYLLLMEKSIAKLDNFIKDVISYSRNTRLELLNEEVNLGEMIESAFQSMNYLEGCQDIERETDLGEGVIFSDPRRLEVILNNLISNAIRYRDPDKNPSRIRISSRNEARQTVIEVEDNGIGIEPQYQERIFDMFFRATKKSQGSGIGLYIVREAVQKLGGRVSVRSTPGEGTLFRIELPYHI